MIGLRYISVYGTEGYAEAARRYLLSLNKLGLPVTWTPVFRGAESGIGYGPFRGTSVGDPELDPLCNRNTPYDVMLFHITPNYYPRLAALDPNAGIAAYSVWETERLPRSWPGFLKPAELLMIPCEWNRATFASGFQGPIEVIPHSVRAGAKVLEQSLKPGGEFVFYSINLWTDRKALHLTLAAYLRAFTAKDRVRLVLKTSERHVSLRVPFTPWYPFHTRWLVDRIVRRCRNPPPVTLITDHLPDQQMEDLHRQGDCYVSLCRAEGWGLGAFDAAAYGRPVIITGFGGQCEFLPEDLAYLVKYRMVGAPFRPLDQHDFGDKWAEADVEHGASLMRQVFENRQEAREKARTLADRLHRQFEPDAIAQKLWDCLAARF